MTPKRAWRSPVLLVVGALLVPAYAAAAPSPAAPPPSAASPAPAGSASRTGLAVTGFQEVGDPNSRITKSAKALTTVGIDGVNLTADGRNVATPGAGARKSLAVAHGDGLRGELLVGNFGASDFNEAHAYRLLSSPANINRVAGALAHDVTAQGWDGISVDLESLTGRDRPGLVDFLAALHAALPAGTTLSVCLSNSPSARTYRRIGYNLRRIAANVDLVVLMAYDEHGTWENHPGPVGGISWQQRGLATLAAAVPNAKIDLGQAGYGYAWRPHRNYQVSDAQARRLVRRNHGRSHYDQAAGEWTAALPDGSALWWADARSYRRRVAIAAHDHLHGIAVWSLGLSDPITSASTLRREAVAVGLRRRLVD